MFDNIEIAHFELHIDRRRSIRECPSRSRFQRDFEVQGDDPEAGSEEEGGPPGVPLPGHDDDDYHFQTRQINVIAKERECKLRLETKYV